jgi:hypothetical protein
VITTVSTGTDVQDGNVLSPLPIPEQAHVTVRRLDNIIDIYINGRRIASVTDPAPLPASGAVGLGVVWDFTAAFDNFVVRK